LPGDRGFFVFHMTTLFGDVPRNTPADWNNTTDMNTSIPSSKPWQFALVPEPAVPFPQVEESELERLKNRLLRQALAQVDSTELAAPLRRAANEAAALAWLEAHPLFVFPSLFEEKVAAAKRRNHKQRMIRARSSELLAQAA
jgi:hypothetical protein